MSASDQMRAMLDELMGTARSGEKSKYDIKFDDHRVCKSFLLGCCPNDLLSATRVDLGECSKIHDIALRADYEKAAAANAEDYFYDVDAAEHLQQFIAECDRKTEQAKRRLKETQEELSEEAAAKINVIHGYGEQIGTKLARAEELGAEGNVEESLKLMEEVEELKKQKFAAENDYRNTMPASNYQQQKLRVCEVCSAFLGIHDNDRRLADHFGGKLHVGFITLRGKLAALQTTMEERRRLREAKRDAERAERRNTRDPPRATSRQRDDGGRDGGREPSPPARRRDDGREVTPSARRRDDGREVTPSSRRRRSRSGSRDRRHRRDGERRRSRSRDRSRRRSRSRSRSHKSSSRHSSRRSRSRSRRSRSGSRHRRRGSRDRGSSRDKRSSRRSPSPKTAVDGM